jgi:hypothetical protein
MYQKPEASEWQTDADGRRYRMVGNGCKEYETILTTTGGQMNAEQLKEWNASKPQREAAARKAEADRQRAAKAAQLHCPFADGLKTGCKGEQCALYLNGCTLARSAAARDTKGLSCPFARGKTPCRADCALYKGGCTLTHKESEVM